MFFPKVITNKEEFIEHIILTCEAYNIEKEKEKAWVKRVREHSDSEAHYFYNMIFLRRVSSYLIFHELVHHLAKELRGLTLSEIWYSLDILIDLLDILFFRKSKVSIYLS